MKKLVVFLGGLMIYSSASAFCNYPIGVDPMEAQQIKEACERQEEALELQRQAVQQQREMLELQRRQQQQQNFPNDAADVLR